MFIKRLLELLEKRSFFLFGVRGCGKSSLLEHFYGVEDALYINLLDFAVESELARNPNMLIDMVEGMLTSVKYVIIDEVQKVPKLLDIVHLLIETKRVDKYFILTGSSARKLKAGGANLLAGRAFVFHLFPFSFLEVANKFILQDALQWGMLPNVFHLKQDSDKTLFLQAYAQTYLKEEVWGEQLVRKLDPFRRFLEVAAQCNGKIINYAKISRDVGADDKTVRNYFSILEDTLLGVLIEPFHHSFRKRFRLSPKFYFIDTGIVRALSRMLSVDPVKSTSYYGDLFEAFVVTECYKLASYYYSEYKFSYLMTEGGVEIDLIIDRPGQEYLFIEIKSKDCVNKEDLRSLSKIAEDFVSCEAVCFSCDAVRKKMGNITVYPWQEGIKRYFSR